MSSYLYTHARSDTHVRVSLYGSACLSGEEKPFKPGRSAAFLRRKRRVNRRGGKKVRFRVQGRRADVFFFLFSQGTSRVHAYVCIYNDKRGVRTPGVASRAGFFVQQERDSLKIDMAERPVFQKKFLFFFILLVSCQSISQARNILWRSSRLCKVFVFLHSFLSIVFGQESTSFLFPLSLDEKRKQRADLFLYLSFSSGDRQKEKNDSPFLRRLLSSPL